MANGLPIRGSGFPFDVRDLRYDSRSSHQPKAVCPRCGQSRAVRNDREATICADCKFSLNDNPWELERWGVAVDWDRIDWDRMDLRRRRAAEADALDDMLDRSA